MTSQRIVSLVRCKTFFNLVLFLTHFKQRISNWWNVFFATGYLFHILLIIIMFGNKCGSNSITVVLTPDSKIRGEPSEATMPLTVNATLRKL
jgi:cellulose synthase/poly-beta-1,6-N-acetylglucosamine synthase-like glycosyltransferase